MLSYCTTLRTLKQKGSILNRYGGNICAGQRLLFSSKSERFGYQLVINVNPVDDDQHIGSNLV